MPQAVPQVAVVEQNRLSVSRLTHSSFGAVPHSVSPAWQERAQTPEPSQTSPAAQPVPQVAVVEQ